MVNSLHAPRPVTRPGKLILAALLTIGGGWIVAISALFVPIGAIAPWGVFIFIGSNVLFGLCVAVGILLAAVAGVLSAFHRHGRVETASSRLNSVSVTALIIVVLAPATCIIEKILTIVALAS